MIAKVIVDIPSKNVDFTFDYIIPSRLQTMLKVGMRVVVPFGSRTIQGYVMSIEDDAEAQMDISKLKEIQEIQDIKPELTPELIKLSEWYSRYFVTKRISILEVMLPSALKAKYQKVFEIVDDSQISADILKRFDSEGHYPYKMAQQNDELDELLPLLNNCLLYTSPSPRD